MYLKSDTEFISIVSHQLRTPLGSMRWYMEMLLGNEFGKLSKEVREVVTQMYGSNLRLIALVNDLLSVSRIEQDRISDIPQETDVVKLIRDTALEIEVEAQKKSIIGKLNFRDNNIPKITIDPRLLRETLLNLLSNAIRYSKKGGEITVEIARESDSLKISIKDRGIGIPKADHGKIFTKYFRTENAVKNDNSGTGLGLFIVKSYIEGWGGKVGFSSEEGKGSVFYFTLPLKPNKLKPEQTSKNE